MNEIITFNNEIFGTLRIVEKDGEPWFVAADVCRALDHTNVTVALERLDADEKAKLNLGLRGGETGCVNEYGLYSLVLGSRKLEAKQFKRWVTHEVLPSIRQNGGYISGQENMTDAEILARSHEIALKIIANQEKRIAEAEKEITKLQEVNEEQERAIERMEPKVTYHDIILSCENAIETRIIAKDYGWSAQRLNKYLEEKGVQYKQGRTWILKQKYADKKDIYTESATTYHTDWFGRKIADITTKWTQTGREFIYNLLASDGILPKVEREEYDDYNLGW